MGDGEKWKWEIIKIGSEGWMGDEEEKGERLRDKETSEDTRTDKEAIKAETIICPIFPQSLAVVSKCPQNDTSR